MWLKRCVAAGLAAGLLLSRPLWTGPRLYPLTPVVGFLHPVGLLYGLLLALLVWIAVTPRPEPWIAAALAIAAYMALCDQSRWQPWFYQYCFMLAALAWRGSSLNVCRLIVAAIYFWSGIQKFNPGFRGDTLPWLLEPFTRWLPVTAIGYIAPAFESLLAPALLARRSRNGAVAAAIAMHVWILGSIGPWGHDSNRVVWPWNLAMMAFVLLLFWHSADFTPGDVLRANRFVLVLFGIAPVLSLAGIWDHYLSFALYSGNPHVATVYMADSIAGRLPVELQEYINQNDSGIDDLPVADWSYGELHVPAYPEMRVFRSVGRRVCDLAGNPAGLLLIVQEKVTLFRRRRQLVYDCAGLSGVASGFPAPPRP